MKYLLIGLLAFANLSAMYTLDHRVYVDEYQLQEETFYIHTGDNIWISTQHLACDDTGLFTYHRSIGKIDKEIVKKWKCPYCFHFWPIGTACQNPDCPSKYR